MTWVKLLSDGNIEVGSEENISIGKASWTRGEQNISQVVIADDDKKYSAGLILDNCPEWWQFDRFEAQIQEGVCIPKKTMVVVQGRITKDMVGLSLRSEATKIGNSFIVNVFLEDPDGILSYNGNVLHAVTNDQVGKWITVVLPRGAPPRILVTDKGKYQ